MATLKIRLRERRNASPKDGCRQAWDEWQVVDGRKILSRHDLESQAKAWLENHKSEGETK
jgi:hypothetical protein